MRLLLLSLFIIILITFSQAYVTTSIEFPSDQRCGGRNIDNGKCCTNENKCTEGEGDCENDDECQQDLMCGDNNCKLFGDFYHEKDDCCVKRSDSDLENKTLPMFPLTEPFPGIYHLYNDKLLLLF